MTADARRERTRGYLLDDGSVIPHELRAGSAPGVSSDVQGAQGDDGVPQDSDDIVPPRGRQGGGEVRQEEVGELRLQQQGRGGGSSCPASDHVRLRNDMLRARVHRYGLSTRCQEQGLGAARGVPAAPLQRGARASPRRSQLH